MGKIVVYPLGEGYLSGAVGSGEIKPRDLGFTPLGGASLFSFTPAKVLKKHDRLGGFFVKTAWGEAFMPYTESVKGRKVGDRFTAQIIREEVEDKPPRVTEYFTLPFGGCEIKRAPAGKVLFVSPCGEGEVKKKLLKEASEKKLRLKVFDCKRCLKEVELFSKFLQRLDDVLPFKWFHFYTQILTSGDESVELLSEDKAVGKHLGVFKELFDPYGRVQFKTTAWRHLVKVLSPRQVERLVLNRKLPLGEVVKDNIPDGFLLIAESEGLVFIDVNGNAPPVQLNRAAAGALIGLYRLRRWGGPLAVDFIPLKEPVLRESFKRYLKELLLQTPCRGFGFTAAGLYEILCPRYTRPLSEVLTESSPYCGRVKRDELLLLEILEAIGDPRGEMPKIKIHPMRKGLGEKLREKLGFEPPLLEDCSIPPDRFEVLF